MVRSPERRAPGDARPRILLLSPLPPPYGGIAHWTGMVTQWAADDGAVDLTVVDTAPKRRDNLETTRLSRLAEGAVRLPRELAGIRRSIRKQRPDVVHLNTSGQLALVRDLAVARICRSLGIPLVYHVRFGRLPDAKAANTREWRTFVRVARSASTVIAIDKRTQEAIESAGQVNVVRIPNFVDSAVITPSSNSAQHRTCVFVGWLIETKGILELVSVWKELAPSGWRLELIGPIDEPFLERLEASGLPDSVVVVGPIGHAEVVTRMQQSSLFVFPSHTEGFPNAVAEAMAVGLPILASAVGAIPEMLEQGAGVTIPARDERALCDELRSLLTDSDRRADLSQRARARVVEHYSKEAIMTKYLDEWMRLSEVGPA